MIYQAINEADAYIAYTTFERDYLINERGVLPDKITVVGVGVDQEPFEQGNGRLIRDRFGWGNEPVVAFVGQQVPHKGIDMVLEAMKQIWQELPETCLLIAGAQTSYSPTLKNQVAQLSPELQMRVAVIDDFVEEEKPAIFAACDLLAFPSGNESFGIVFLEAWAAKKPVVGARIGAVPTVVNEGKDGLLIEHRNTNELVQAIRTLLVNPELRNRFGAAGYHKVRQNYTWDIVADKFRAVYVKSLQNRPHK
jgi:glycosyltransferase involved in cell wall biosynthesis